MREAELCLVPLEHSLLDGFPHPKGGRKKVDVVVIFVFSDVRPLKGLSAYLDWRTHGCLSRSIDSGVISGARGMMVECDEIREIPCKLLVAIGLGSIQEIHPEELLAWPRHIIRKCIAVEADTLAIDCPPEINDSDEIRRFLNELHTTWQERNSVASGSGDLQGKTERVEESEEGLIEEFSDVASEPSSSRDDDEQDSIPFVDPIDVVDIDGPSECADMNSPSEYRASGNYFGVQEGKLPSCIWVVLDSERIRELEARKGPSLSIRKPS